MPKNTVVRAAYETQQFFEVDLPEGMTAAEYMETKEFREECAALVKSGFIEFGIEREYDAEGNEV